MPRLKPEELERCLDELTRDARHVTVRAVAGHIAAVEASKARLLEACKASLSIVDEHAQHGLSRSARTAGTLIRTAIAAAEGDGGE